MSNTVPCRPKKNSRIANSPQKFRDHVTVTGLDSQPPFKRGNSTLIHRMQEPTMNTMKDKKPYITNLFSDLN